MKFRIFLYNITGNAHKTPGHESNPKHRYQQPGTGLVQPGILPGEFDPGQIDAHNSQGSAAYDGQYVNTQAVTLGKLPITFCTIFTPR
jgi:hypothetical protein